MNNIYSNPTPLRQKFIEYLTLNRKAERTVHIYVSFIYSLARHSRRSPDLLGPEDIRRWLYHLIAERKQAPSTVNLAINAVRSSYGGLLQRQIEPLLHPKRLYPPRGHQQRTPARSESHRPHRLLRLQGLRRRRPPQDPHLAGVEFIRRLGLHLLSPRFTKIRHYGLLGNNRRHQRVPLARTALQTSPLRFAPKTAPPPAAPAPPPLACPHCQGTDLRCIGRVERSGKVSLFARVILSRAAPAYADSS